MAAKIIHSDIECEILQAVRRETPPESRRSFAARGDVDRSVRPEEFASRIAGAYDASRLVVDPS